MNSPAYGPERIADQVSAALGQAPVDLVLNGGRIVNAYSGEIHRGDVAVYDGRIVAIREKFAGPAKKTLDVTGKYLAPALVDSIFQRDTSLMAPTPVRGSGMIVHVSSPSKKELRRRKTVCNFAETRHAIRNGWTAFLDERIGPRALGLLLDEVRREEIDISQICFALDPRKPAAGADHPVRIAMESGFSPAQAFQLATLNPAAHHGIDDQTGSVAPGRVAHLLIFEDWADMRPERMIHQGGEITEA